MSLFSLVRRNAIISLSLLLCSLQAFASTLTVSDAWARPTFAMATTGAAYITLHNASDKDERLVSVSVSESIARKAEIHDHIMQDDMMKMRHMEDGVIITSGSTVTFAPGGKHIMLMGLTGPLEQGNALEVTLVFEHAGSQVVTVPIGEVKQQDKSHHYHH